MQLRHVLSRFGMQSQYIQTSWHARKSNKSKEIEHLLSGSQCKVSPSNGIFALPANLNKSFYYSLIEHLLCQVEHHHLELTCYKKIKFVLSTTHSNGYGHFANYCISILEHGNLPTEPLMKGFHKWCISKYGTVDGKQKDCSQTQARWSKGYALHEELYGCCAFLEYLLLYHTNKWTTVTAHGLVSSTLVQCSCIHAPTLVNSSNQQFQL
jgi:hypothetical protein